MIVGGSGQIGSARGCAAEAALGTGSACVARVGGVGMTGADGAYGEFRGMSAQVRSG